MLSRELDLLDSRYGFALPQMRFEEAEARRLYGGVSVVGVYRRVRRGQ